MRNKPNWYSVLLIGLVLLLASSVLDCASSTNSQNNDELSIKKELTQELWQSLIDYLGELAVVDAITDESLDDIYNALKDGNITTLKFRKRLNEITLIQANTIKYIDRKPEYLLLHTFMWEDGKAPTLAWCIPELESDPERSEFLFQDYLEGYIVHHDTVIDEFLQILRERANELGIELSHDPSF